MKNHLETAAKSQGQQRVRGLKGERRVNHPVGASTGEIRLLDDDSLRTLDSFNEPPGQRVREWRLLCPGLRSPPH